MTDDPRLSPAHTKNGRLQRALLERLDVHEREGTLPTSGRFLFYELVQSGVIPKAPTGKRRADQDMIDALTALREAGLVPWNWIVDETRELDEWHTAPTVAEFVSDAAQYASIDRWAGEPAPLILCESRSLSGALHDLAALYACPKTSTNGQAKGHLVNRVVPLLSSGRRRVLYVGDWDWCGHQIEAATRRTLAKHTGVRERPWERIALTEQQVIDNDLPVIMKPDKRYTPKRKLEAVETEALGQGLIVGLLRARLDELMPEPLDDVLERQRVQRERVAEQLRGIG